MPSTVSGVTPTGTGCGDRCFAKGVDRTGADITVDDAGSAKRQGPEPARLSIIISRALVRDNGPLRHGIFR